MMKAVSKQRRIIMKNRDVVIIIIIIILMLQLIKYVNAGQISAMFVFGDSLVDNGNNNYLNSLAKSNYYPYGIDFNGGPTGRFNNGRTVVDMIGEFLGLPYIPAYADPSTKGVKILGGVNYASAAGGILDETGQHFGQRYNLNQQVLNFENNLNQLRSMMSGNNLTQYLSKSIVIMVLGSNDYLNNYLMPSLYFSSYNYSPSVYANLLLNRYARQILALNSLGLRKFFIAGIGPLGCIPNQRALGQAQLTGRCMDYVNQIIEPFNDGLRSLVDQLNSNHSGAIFAYGNTYGAIVDILNNPSRYGFGVIEKACCGLGQNRGQITCLPFAIPCSNRNQYVFWDAFHPTEVTNALLASRAFNGSQSDCYPINIQQMVLI